MVSGPVMRHSSCFIAFASILILSACTNRAPVRLVIPTDTLVINSTDWTPLGVQLLDARGEAVVPQTPIRFRAVEAPPLSIGRDGAINCQDDGVGRIIIEVDTLRAERPIRCHIARRFGPPEVLRLIAGGPPIRFHVEAYDKDGRLIANPWLYVTVRDTTILRFENGLVYGLRPGASDVSVRSAGKGGAQVFFVYADQRQHSAARRTAQTR
jgi:hypothetical protein